MNPASREVTFWLSGFSFPSDPYVQVFQNKSVQDTPRQPTCGHFPPDCARLLISSTVFLRESWSARDTNTGRRYFIRAEREGGVLVGVGPVGARPPWRFPAGCASHKGAETALKPQWTAGSPITCGPQMTRWERDRRADPPDWRALGHLRH